MTLDFGSCFPGASLISLGLLIQNSSPHYFNLSLPIVIDTASNDCTTNDLAEQFGTFQIGIFIQSQKWKRLSPGGFYNNKLIRVSEACVYCEKLDLLCVT